MMLPSNEPAIENSLKSESAGSTNSSINLGMEAVARLKHPCRLLALELNILRGSSLSLFTYPVAIDMLTRKQPPMDQIITHELPLAEFQQGVDLVASGTESIKVVLKPFE